jgi:hypothetical protein
LFLTHGWLKEELEWIIRRGLLNGMGINTLYDSHMGLARGFFAMNRLAPAGDIALAEFLIAGHPATNWSCAAACTNGMRV